MFAYTEGSTGNIANIEPAMKKQAAWLSDTYTVEWDYLLSEEDQVFQLMFKEKDGEATRFLAIDYANGVATY